MPPAKRHNCQTCGVVHRRQVADCWHCAREKALAGSVKYCALCDNEIPSYRKATPYCSRVCASAISTARVGIGNKIARLVRSGEFLPASSRACVDCGAPARHYEHREYLKPLSVEPVCQPCNRRRGAALDVKGLVAKQLGVSVDCLPGEMARKREEDRAWREATFPSVRPLVVPPGITYQDLTRHLPKGRPLVDHAKKVSQTETATEEKAAA